MSRTSLLENRHTVVGFVLVQGGLEWSERPIEWENKSQMYWFMANDRVHAESASHVGFQTGARGKQLFLLH